MAFEGMSFNLFTDEDCLVGFGGTLQLLNETDLSDNPQDFTLYLGSVNVDRQLNATSNPGVDDIVITITDILPEWQASIAYIVGDRVQAVGGDGFVYKCTDAGTSAGSQPTWPVGGLGSTVVDGGVIWTKISAKHEITEISLSLTEVGLDSATPGDPLALGSTINGDAVNAVPIWVRVENAVTNVANNTGHEELALYINEVIETAIP